MLAPQPKKAYAVLAGGGVKGAALVGCLTHASKLGIEFVGYGGSSAGALVATLAALGFSPDELFAHVVEAPFVDIVAPEDRGAKLRVLTGLAPSRWSSVGIAGALMRSFPQLPLLAEVGGRCGLLDGEGLKAFIVARLKEKGIPEKVRFSELPAHIGGRVLKVMCTDLTLRKAVEFGPATPRDPEVVTAVRASCAYPVIFKPQPDVVEYRSQDGNPRKITHQLVDGGLASNLPISLFDRESRDSGHNIIAFDLVQEVAPPEGAYGIGRMLSDMYATALSTGDTMAQLLMAGNALFTHVKVIIPPDVNTFDIHMSAVDAKRLFDAGVECTRLALGDAPTTVEQLLEGMVRQVAARWPKSGSLRASVMVPDGSGQLAIAHAYNMEGATDRDLVLPIGAGVAGAAWTSRAARAFDPRAGMTGLSKAQLALIPPDRLAMISFPVRPSSASGATWTPAGILTIDSSTALDDTGWLDDQGVAISEMGATWSLKLAPLLAGK